MLVTIVTKRFIKDHYNYKVQDSQGNTTIIHNIAEDYPVNSIQDLNITIQSKEVNTKQLNNIEKAEERIKELEQLIYYCDSFVQSGEYRKEIEYYKTKIQAIKNSSNKEEYLHYMANCGYNVLHTI